MAQNDPKEQKSTRNHFLFHIFRMDKDDNPMPRIRAESLMDFLKKVFQDATKNE